MRRTRWILLLGLLLVPGCAQTFDATGLGVPATLAAAAGEIPTGQPFEVTTHTVHGLFGLITLKKATLEQALAAELVGGTAVARVRIRTRARFLDLLVTGLTLGLIAPRTVTYEGIIVGR